MSKQRVLAGKLGARWANVHRINTAISAAVPGIECSGTEIRRNGACIVKIDMNSVDEIAVVFQGEASCAEQTGLTGKRLERERKLWDTYEGYTPDEIDDLVPVLIRRLQQLPNCFEPTAT